MTLPRVAIPSYSEVLFLRAATATLAINHLSRNPFLFRGPIPTKCDFCKKRTAKYSRNPFLFRGPIPTKEKKYTLLGETVVSQSLLIQRSYSYREIQELKRKRLTLVAIPSYSEVLFLP